jgi:hypothetical protein
MGSNLQTLGIVAETYTTLASTQSVSGVKTLASPKLAAAEFTSSPTGDGATQWAEVTVSTAELLALRATPKTLVAAPGATKVLEFVSAILLLDYAGVAYAEDGGGSNLGVRYTNGSGVQVSQTIESTGFITLTADSMTTSLAKIDAIVSAAASANQALVLHNIGAGELVTGTSPIRVKVCYRVWTTGF